LPGGSSRFGSDDDDPVERTRRQLRCYYDCVSRYETFGPLTACGHAEECPQCSCDDDDELTELHDEDDPYFW
jgi:hypothetical protein